MEKKKHKTRETVKQNKTEEEEITEKKRRDPQVVFLSWKIEECILRPK